MLHHLIVAGFISNMEFNMKAIIIFLLILLFSSCYWTPIGANTIFGIYADGHFLSEEEIAEKKKELQEKEKEDTTTITIYVTWPE